MTGRGRTQTLAMRSRNPPDIRLRANIMQLRHIAKDSPLAKGTRNRLHAIAHSMDYLLDEMLGLTEGFAISWTGEEATVECAACGAPTKDWHSQLTCCEAGKLASAPASREVEA